MSRKLSEYVLRVKRFSKVKRRGSAPVQAIGAITAIIGFLVIVSTLIHLINGDIGDWIQFLLSNFVFFNVVIEFPFGITIIVLFTAGGIKLAVSRGGR